jgi:hypothetical protein
VSPDERDRWRRFRRNWWIRLLLPVWVQHVWLIVVTALVVSALVAFNDQQQRSTELGLAIQQQRADAIRDGCQEQNGRHDRTIVKLEMLIAAIKDPARRRRAERNVGGTIALIDALAPKQDCGRLVRQRVLAPPK